MNIFNLLTKEKRVAGIEISDLVVRVAYFDHKRRVSQEDKNNLKVKDLILFETPIPPNTVSGGKVIDKDILIKILKNIWRKERLGKRHAIVSIQEDSIYSKKTSFPKTEKEEHLEQAINLTLDFQLPYKKESAYVGWEKTATSRSGEDVLLSSIPKEITDDYVLVMDQAKISMLALESHLASISRSILLEKETVTLLNKNNQNSTTFLGLKDNSLYFSRTIPFDSIPKGKNPNEELIKTKNYLEFETKKIVKELDYSNAQVRIDYAKEMGLNINPKLESKWLICLGAAIRGELPDGKDEHISLLPIGTADAYEYQKLRIFITLMRNIIIGIATFFVIAFAGSYVLALSLSESFNNQDNSLSVSLISSDIILKESAIKEINDLTTITSKALSNTPNWSLLIEEINRRTVSGVIITNFKATSTSDPISINGVAKNREILNSFKKSLQESSYLKEIELPINNLELKEDIPFSITFKLKDPSMILYK